MAKRTKVKYSKEESIKNKTIKVSDSGKIMPTKLDGAYIKPINVFIKSDSINNTIKDWHTSNFSNYKQINPKGNELDFCKIELTHQNDTIKELIEKGTKRSPEEAIILQRANDYVKFLENILGFKGGLKEMENQKKITLKWTGLKKVLINVIYQLKKENGKDGQPLLNNSDEELADFLIQNVDVFKNTKLSTIRADLSKQGNAKKSSKQIIVKFSEK